MTLPQRAMAVWLFPILAMGSCSRQPELKPFTSDGCSLFPDGSLITGNDWCSCCFDHDLAYWRGGTERQRNQADAELRNCVLEKTGNEVLAKVMYEGVRVGGSPHFYNWYRWGYGWRYDRTYGALSEPEAKLADRLEAEYIGSAGGRVCRQ